MNDDDMSQARFSGRTYSRSRQNRNTDDGSTVPVKAAVSLSKWGQANYVPYREGLESIPTDVKKPKMESRGEDPFSFDSEDKSKSPVKKQHALPKSDRPTMLPASRIVTSGKGVVEQMNEEHEQPSIRTYSRTPVAKKNIIEDQFMEVGRTFINKEGDRVFIPQKTKSEVKEENEEDDDIFPAVFKRDPLKTYAGEVVTPVDKPDSPPPKKGRYQKTGGQRGRKPLTVSDPGLIEEYKKNYAAQQMKGKTDTDTGGLNNSMVVSKQELANEEQGTTVVVVCKPKAKIDKGEVSSKYFTRSPRKQGLTVLDVASDSSQESSQKNENGKSDSQTTVTGSQESTSLRTRSRRLANASPESMDSASSNSQASPVCKRLTRGRGSNADWSSQGSGIANDSSSQSEGSGSRGGKRYRIFKSRTQVEECKDTEAKEAHEDDSATDLSSQQEKNLEDDSQSKDNPMEVDESTEDPMSSLKSQDETPEMPQEASETIEEEPATKEIDPATARQSLAARLKTLEKGNESDSTEQDNASECSENMPSQESPANSQTIEEKEDVVAAPRRFFKSKKSISNSSELQRKLLSSSPQKSPAKATYNARSWQNENSGDKEEEAEKIVKRSNSQDDVVLVRDSNRAPRLSREVHWPERKYDEAYTSLRVNKKHKELYTVVHNVKQTHEVQELGETQDFMDDVDYLLDSLRDTNSTSIRCLSCLKLAGKCIMPAFRMHIRAHGTVGIIFSLLHDACTDPSLALSTSAMMFMLSRDRLNMDLDKESLNLMLKLNEVDVSEKGKSKDATIGEFGKTKERVQELLAQLQQETNAREIDLGFVSTGNLAMESLLSLTSRRAGEWFKEELRSAGGLDHIVDSVVSSEHQLTEDLEKNIQKAIPSLKKLDRCLRVLENISHMNSDNQAHLINYKNAALLVSCSRALRLCQKCMPMFKVLESVEENKAVKDLPGFTILTCLLAVLRVLLNVTHEHNLGSFTHTDAKPLITATMNCLTSTQWCVPVEQRFDLAVLTLGLLINMMESSENNHKTFMEMKVHVRQSEDSPAKTMSAVQAVLDIFCQREEAAREMEETNEGTSEADTSGSDSPNKSGEWKETDAGIQWITKNLQKAKEEREKQAAEQPEGEGNQSILEDDDETFTKALHKAGKHMENSIVASYAGLLLGSIMNGNKDYTSYIKKIIPNQDFKPMIKILKKFLNFMSLTTAFGSTDVNGITQVIEMLESA